MKFKGDIIITDPCYLHGPKDFWEQDDVDIFTGAGIENYGFTSYLWENTVYGDWSCTTYNKNTGESIGNFCADAGLVGVFLLSEVLQHNPNFDYHINSPWTCTLIKDFEGEVYIEYNADDDNNQVIGEGNINFYTKQTGM